MAEYLKKRTGTAASDDTEAAVRTTVEKIVAEVKARGDAAVRDLSQRFDNWSPEDFRLSSDEIERLVASVPEQAIADIKFAQAQIRHFAEV